MTDPAGGAPTPPPPSGNWQAPPPPPAGVCRGGFNPNFQQAAGRSRARAGHRLCGPRHPHHRAGDRLDHPVRSRYLITSRSSSAIFGGLFGWFLGSIVYLAGSAAYFVYTLDDERATYGQKILKLETVNAADGATLTQHAGHPPLGVPVRPGGRLGDLHEDPGGRPRIAAHPGPARVPALDPRPPLLPVPALHHVAEPQAPGLPRRPGRHRGDQAPLAARHHVAADERGRSAGPVLVSQRLRLEVEASGRGAAGTPPAAAGRSRDPADAEPLGGRHEQRVRQPRAGARPPRPSAPPPGARSSGVGATRRIASAISACEHRLGRGGAQLALEQHVQLRERRGRPAAAARPRARTRPTAARWLRSATSAAATTADGSSRTPPSESARSPARLAPRDRPPVERQAPVAAPADAQERELGRRLVLVQPGLERRGDHGRSWWCAGGGRGGRAGRAGRRRAGWSSGRVFI